MDDDDDWSNLDFAALDAVEEQHLARRPAASPTAANHQDAPLRPLNSIRSLFLAMPMQTHNGAVVTPLRIGKPPLPAPCSISQQIQDHGAPNTISNYGKQHVNAIASLRLQCNEQEQIAHPATASTQHAQARQVADGGQADLLGGWQRSFVPHHTREAALPLSNAEPHEVNGGHHTASCSLPCSPAHGNQQTHMCQPPPPQQPPQQPPPPSWQACDPGGRAGPSGQMQHVPNVQHHLAAMGTPAIAATLPLARDSRPHQQPHAGNSPALERVHMPNSAHAAQHQFSHYAHQPSHQGRQQGQSGYLAGVSVQLPQHRQCLRQQHEGQGHSLQQAQQLLQKHALHHRTHVNQHPRPHPLQPLQCQQHQHAQRRGPATAATAATGAGGSSGGAAPCAGASMGQGVASGTVALHCGPAAGTHANPGAVSHPHGAVPPYGSVGPALAGNGPALPPAAGGIAVPLDSGSSVLPWDGHGATSGCGLSGGAARAAGADSDGSLPGSASGAVGGCNTAGGTARSGSRGGSGGACSGVSGAHASGTFATAVFVLEVEGYFSVHCKGHRGVEAVISAMPGAVHDPACGSWRFPVGRYTAVCAALQTVPGVRVEQQGLVDLVATLLREAAKVPDDSKRYERLAQHRQGEESLHERMRPFQRDGVKFALSHGGRVLIGDEMGLGKTVQACALMRCYESDWPALIVTPATLRDQWAEALFLWIRVLEDDIMIVNSKKDFKAAAEGRYKVLIVAYTSISNLVEAVKLPTFKMVVCDEAHFLKNAKVQRTKVTLPLIKSARRAVLLTGTPALSRPDELLTLVQGLLPAARSYAKDFLDRYCEPVQTRWGKKWGGGSPHLEELHRLLTGTIMIRRRKADVLKELPPKIRQQIYLRLGPDEERRLKSSVKEMAALREIAASLQAGACKLDQDGIGPNSEQHQLLTSLYSTTAKCKVKAVAEYVSELLESSDSLKFLVFAHHKELLDGIEQVIKEKKVKFMRIDGGTPSHLRDGYRKQFQEQADVRVAVLSIKAAGVGLTLTAASHVIFAELSWVPGDVVQAEDRVHRIGQACSVNIQFLLVRNSIDEIMWESLQNKLKDVGKVLDGKQDSLQVNSTRIMLKRDQLTLDGSLSGGASFVTGLGNAAGVNPSAASHNPPASQTTQQTKIESYFVPKPRSPECSAPAAAHGYGVGPEQATWGTAGSRGTGGTGTAGSVKRFLQDGDNFTANKAMRGGHDGEN